MKLQLCMARPPTIDGSISVGEWNDAASVSYYNITFLFLKQDGKNLYIAFNISDATYDSEDWTAVYIDVNHDKSMTLQPDDIAIGLYRDGTFGEANVTDGKWTEIEASGWSANRTTFSDMQQVEFNISYTKIDVIAGVEKTLGVAFSINAEGSDAFTWPPPNGSWDDLIKTPYYWGDVASAGYDWIPEFPSFLVLPLFMMATLLIVIIYKRKHTIYDKEGNMVS